ncbi:MAG: methyltransferase domain-containing protein [Phycisphaerales bacterium]|nr:MAG: methyltransferase domain-containing protein [Phycisphaerales bacterium]
MNEKLYKWWYDNIESKFYNPMIKWIMLPFGGEAALRRKMIEPVSFGGGERIFEMCCGTGGATFFIAEKAGNTCEIIGMDLSSGQLRHAKKRQYSCPVQFIEGDVTRTPFQENSFDKVLITHAIHEMPREARLAVLTEAKRVLKHRGQVIVLELDNPPSIWLRMCIGLWFLYWLPGNFETPTRRDMLRHGLSNEVKESGFRDVKKYSAYRGIFQTVIGTK